MRLSAGRKWKRRKHETGELAGAEQLWVVQKIVEAVLGIEECGLIEMFDGIGEYMVVLQKWMTICYVAAGVVGDDASGSGCDERENESRQRKKSLPPSCNGSVVAAALV